MTNQTVYITSKNGHLEISDSDHKMVAEDREFNTIQYIVWEYVKYLFKYIL